MAKEKETQKAQVWAYVGNNRGVSIDSEGNKHRNDWIKLNLELDSDEVIEKLSWRTTQGESEVGWGGNNVVTTQQDLNQLVGTLLTLCDAMIADKEQKEAWKQLIRTNIYQWHDEKFSRHNLSI